MNKNIRLFVVVWVWIIALFNLIAFFIPTMPPVEEKFNTPFVTGCIGINLVFICHLLCSIIALKDSNAKKIFYNIPIIRICYSSLIVSFVIGSICIMFTPTQIIGTVVCACIFVFNAFSMVKAETAIAEVERIDEKVKTQTFFIKSLTIDAETLMASAKDEAIKAECRKVAEALRYSDPMSSDALASVESAINIKFADLQIAVQANNKEKSLAVADELIILIGDRNRKCTMLK